MSVIFLQVFARLRRTLGRFVGLAGAALFSLVLASCAGGGFGRTGDAGNTPDIPGVNPVSEPVSAAAGPITCGESAESGRGGFGLGLGRGNSPDFPGRYRRFERFGNIGQQSVFVAGTCGAGVGLGGAGGFGAEDGRVTRRLRLRFRQKIR